MGAAERPAHFGAQPVSDVVSSYPASGSVAEGGGHVGGIGFRADDDDPVTRIAVGSITAAPRKFRAVDDHEVWREVAHRCREVLVEEAYVPATVFALEELEDHPLHRMMCDGDQNQRGVVAHRTAFAVHDLIIARCLPDGIRWNYGTRLRDYSSEDRSSSRPASRANRTRSARL